MLFRSVMSGQVFDNNGVPLEGVRVHNGAQGGAYRVGYSDSYGNYAIGNNPPGNYTNFVFNYGSKPLPLFVSPVQVTVQDVGGLDHLVTDFPHVSIVALSDADEGAPISGQFQVTRTGSTVNDLRVYYVASGTALRNIQYQAFATNVVIIPAGSASTTLDVVPLADGTFQGPTTVTVTLRLATNEVRIVNVVTNVNGTNIVVARTNTFVFPGWELMPVNGQLTWFQTYPQYVLGKAEATLKVLDADIGTELPRVSIAAVDNTAVETGGDSATMMVTRTGSVEFDLTVYYTLIPGTNFYQATVEDYIPVPGQITIPAGQTFVTFPIIARDDLFVEGAETLLVRLSNHAEYTVGTRQAQVLIVDDDLPVVWVDSTDAIAGEGGNTGTFTFTRAGSLSGNLVVNYLVTGTATSGADYQGLSGQVTIAAGQNFATVAVTPLEDALLEGDETVTVFISESTLYNIVNPSGATVVIQD